MPEESGREEQIRGAEPAATPESLKSQADAVRRDRASHAGEFYSRVPSPGRMVLCLILVGGVLAASVLLLIARDTRLHLLEVALGDWLPPEAGEEVFRLPPPPPPSPGRRISGARADANETPEDAPSGVLFLDQFPAESDLVSEPEVGEAAEAAPLPAKNDRNTEAWELLRRKTEAVSRLLSGEDPDLDFVSWAPLKEDPPEFWIDLTARRESGAEEVHLIWSVNLETERIDPLSQAARDLEFAR